MITITLNSKNIKTFEKIEGLPLYLGFSACGYITVNSGPSCIYKEDLKNVKSFFIGTPNGSLVGYKKPSTPTKEIK